MVATTLAGGLGNQLFMYAAARAMSIRLGTGLVLNTKQGFLDDWQFHRNYELQEFNIPYKESRFLTFDYRGGNRIMNLSRKYGRNFLFPSQVFLRDNTKNKGIDERFFEQKGKSVYLEGYWPSEIYFANQKQFIRNDLKWDNLRKSELLSSEEHDVMTTIDKCPVCLGIRRYQECKSTPSIRVCEAGFYLKSIDLIARKLPKPPLFYIFTQDIEWTLENICRQCNYEFKFIQEKRAIEDLYLMSIFRYHIISNSTFYWWGAWLADGDLVVSSNNFTNRYTNLSSWISI